MIEDLKHASLVIPQIIVGASIDNNIYPVSTPLNKSFLFYRQLFVLPNEWIDYDSFNYIPLTYDEIIMYVYYSDQFNTLLTGKITNLTNKLMYIP